MANDIKIRDATEYMIVFLWSKDFLFLKSKEIKLYKINKKNPSISITNPVLLPVKINPAKPFTIIKKDIMKLWLK